MSSLVFDPTSPAVTRALLQELGAAPNRTLGQNFLINPGARDRIAEQAAISSDDAVLEIGPGLGSLTCRLVDRAGQVTAIEKDLQFAGLLKRYFAGPQFHLVEGDALKVDWADLQLPETGVKVAANLPYSISKPMLRRLLEEWRPHLQSATVMVQREVADRLVAKAGTSAYGPMAIMARLYTQAKLVFDVKPGSFFPPPEVTSSVVHLQILATPSVALDDEKFFWRVVQAAFSQRRKQLGNTLRSVLGDRDLLHGALNSLDIDPQRRGETLSLEEFARLAHHLRSIT